MKKLYRSLRQEVESRYSQWIDRRIPPSQSVVLTQKNIFIFPNRQALFYLLVVILIWIAATNYESNLAFGLCFLMMALFVVCILHTFGNMSGLKITAIRAEPVFEGEYSEIELLVEIDEQKIRDAVSFGYEKGRFVKTALVTEKHKRLRVPVKAGRRGLYDPGRITIETTFPLGIIRSWSYINLDTQILTWPKPICHAHMETGSSSNSEGEEDGVVKGGEEFESLQDYYPQASLRQVAWKHFAKGQGLKVKEYVDYVDNYLWLDWDDFPGLGVEERLSTLCYWVLECEKTAEVYGLRIPGKEIEPGNGKEHLDRTLTVLALYGEPSLQVGSEEII